MKISTKILIVLSIGTCTLSTQTRTLNVFATDEAVVTAKETPVVFDENAVAPTEPIPPVDPISPIDPTPVDPTPVDPTPVDPAPIDPTPVDPAPVDPAPVDPTPVDPAPMPQPTPSQPINPIPDISKPTQSQINQSKNVRETVINQTGELVQQTEILQDDTLLPSTNGENSQSNFLLIIASTALFVCSLVLKKFLNMKGKKSHA